MPSFSFTIVKKPIERKQTKSTHSNIKHKGLSLVVNTTEDGLFFVTYNGVDYTISLDSYNCNRSNEVYIMKLYKGKIIRYSNPGSIIGNAKNYVRFIPGTYVKGYIFHNVNTGKDEFYVEHVLTDIDFDVEIRKKFYKKFKLIKYLLDVKLKKFRESQW